MNLQYVQSLDCHQCGVNAAEKPVIGLPITYLCHDCYSKQVTLQQTIEILEIELELCENRFKAENMLKENTFLKDRIKTIQAVIDRQTQTIENQGNACQNHHNIMCELKEIVDKYFGEQI